MSSTMTIHVLGPIYAGELVLCDTRTPVVGWNKHPEVISGVPHDSPRNRPLNMHSASSPFSLNDRVNRELE